jgi:hypothetical protein
MVPVICIDDKNIPKEIPPHKRVKEGQEYNITEVAFCKPQNVSGISLYELPLGEESEPYLYWQFKRFAIREEDIPKLEELIEACNSLGEFDTSKLLDKILTEQLETV